VLFPDDWGKIHFRADFIFQRRLLSPRELLYQSESSVTRGFLRIRERAKSQLGTTPWAKRRMFFSALKKESHRPGVGTQNARPNRRFRLLNGKNAEQELDCTLRSKRLLIDLVNA